MTLKASTHASRAPSGSGSLTSRLGFPGLFPSDPKIGADLCAFSSGFRTAPLGAGADLGVGTHPPGWAWGLLLCHYEGPRTTHRPRGSILRRFRVRLTGSLPRRRGLLHLRRPGLPRAQAWRPESSAHPCGWRARIARALSLRSLWRAARAGDTLPVGSPFVWSSLQVPYRPIGRFPEGNRSLIRE